MPRTRFEDDDRDEPRSRVRNNSGPVVLILAVVAGFLLLLVVGGGLTAFLMVNRARQAESLARAEAREAA